MKSATRPYRMGARAESTAATRRAIADAWLALFAERHYDELTLDMVAARAGTTVQTVIRHYGSKDELFAAVLEEFAADEAARRAATPVGDVGAAVRSIVARYDEIGGIVLRGLAQEDRLPALGEAIAQGRAIHREWVARTFAPLLDRRAGAERRRLHAQLVVLTDIYTWKLLRRDQGFGRRQTEAAMTEMIEGLIA
jgi:AcrR family transcriptional regulator